jgi:hypothetical protein
VGDAELEFSAQRRRTAPLCDLSLLIAELDDLGSLRPQFVGRSDLDLRCPIVDGVGRDGVQVHEQEEFHLVGDKLFEIRAGRLSLGCAEQWISLYARYSTICSPPAKVKNPRIFFLLLTFSSIKA